MNQMSEHQSPNYLTRKWALIAAVLSSPLYFLFDHLGDPGRARAAVCAGIVIIAAVRSRWDLRRSVLFWATIALLILAHVPLILLTPWTNDNLPSISLLPFGMLDFVVMYGCIKLVEKAMKSDPLHRM
jgi:hypothetical protein